MLAATLVTFTFLMSPVIEEMFGQTSYKYLLEMVVIRCVSVVTKISEINTHNANNTLVWPPDS